MFGWAVKKRLLAEHPLRGVERPAKRRRKRILTHDEQVLLFQKIRDRQFREYCFALLATGARPMEVAAVTAAQVPRDGATWVLAEHKTEGTGNARVIYLSPEMQELTRKLLREHPEGPLFRSYRKKAGVRRPWTRNGIRCRFKRLREKHPELAGVTAYALRHTYATQALTNGVPAAVVATLLGHRTTRMLDEHYNHTDQAQDVLKEAARKATRGCA